jgi:HAE1 family hydrophobic/amphiphilic exporter-1
VIDTGPGSEMRQALGIAVFFGMIGVTLFGLLFTPSFYVISREFGTWASERLPGELRKLRLPRLGRAP